MRRVERPVAEIWERWESEGRRFFPHEALYEVLRAAHQTERIPLAGLLYRLGDLRAYAPLNRAIGEFSSESSPREVEMALDVTETIGSKRFIPCLMQYTAVETRPWFLNRGRSVIRHLRARGTNELSIAQLLEHAEQAWAGHERLKALELLDELLLLEATHPRALYLKANYLKEQGDVA